MDDTTPPVPPRTRPGKNGGTLLVGAQPENGMGAKGGAAISLKSRLKAKLEQSTGDPRYPTVADALIAATVKEALVTDGQSRKLIFQTEGSLSEKIEHDGALRITVEYGYDRLAEEASGPSPDQGESGAV